MSSPITTSADFTDFATWVSKAANRNIIVQAAQDDITLSTAVSNLTHAFCARNAVRRNRAALLEQIDRLDKDEQGHDQLISGSIQILYHLQLIKRLGEAYPLSPALPVPPPTPTPIPQLRRSVSFNMPFSKPASTPATPSPPPVIIPHRVARPTMTSKSKKPYHRSTPTTPTKKGKSPEVIDLVTPRASPAPQTPVTRITIIQEALAGTPQTPTASSSKICFKCHKVGHKQVQCREFSCYNCKCRAPGHYSRDCGNLTQSQHVDYDYDDYFDDDAIANMTDKPYGY
ncbi:hypothetical protein DXG03_000991 [Asterophora parasitica]|uniref:CCHC-type domain-containing protein n=1 Tax=Asterophora parasitica TaxID=117018 RepID=A0A9P7FZK5_9AGAR|nr:hypothetical protein DXG03_000991 [Asterophora parasitica]